MESSEQTDLKASYTRNVANTLMLMAAGRSSFVVDTFLSWLLAGSGAAIALIISGLDGLSRYLAPGAVKAGAVMFLVAAAFGVAEKYLASIIQGSAEGAKEARQLAEETTDDDIEIDLEIIYREFEDVTYPATRWFMRKFGLGFRPASPTSVGQRVSRQAQIQSLLALVATVLVFASMTTIVCGLGG